jgi:hypothetical protein
LGHNIIAIGPRQEIAEFLQYVESLASARVTIAYSTPAPDPLSRKPFGQFDIIQAIVTFASSALAPIATAEIQSLIKGWNEKHKNSRIEIEQAPRPESQVAEASPDE